MNTERWLILTFGVVAAGAAVMSGISPAMGFPVWVPVTGGVLGAMASAGLVFLRSWFDAAPSPPHG